MWNFHYLSRFITSHRDTKYKKRLKNWKKMWENPSIMCPLINFNFNTSTVAFNLDWLLVKINQEVEEATHEGDQIRTKSAAFLYQERKTRVKRGAPVAAAVMAGIGLFGGGVLLGGRHCGLTGRFGLCQNHGRENAANIDRLNQYASVLTNLFLIMNELGEKQKTQTEMQNNQNQNWTIVEKQFEIFEGNIHILRDCNELLFSNQQFNFNFDNVAALLNVLYSDIKTTGQHYIHSASIY